MRSLLYRCAFVVFPRLKHRYHRELLEIFINDFIRMHHDIDEVSAFGIQMISIEAQYVVINGNRYLDIIHREMNGLAFKLKKLDASKPYEIADLKLTDEMNQDDKLMIMEKCTSIYNEIKSHYLNIFNEILESLN